MKNPYLIFFWSKEFTFVKHGEKAQCLGCVFLLYFQFNGLESYSVAYALDIQMTKDLDEIISS